MAESKTQIVIAVIGLAGVLGAAVISKYGLPTSLTATSSVSNTPSPGSTPGQPKPDGKGQGNHEPLPADGDVVKVRSVTPPTGTALHAAQSVDFKIDLTYRLQSLDNAALSIDLDQHDNSSNCSGEAHIHASQRVAITRGEHQITVVIPYRADAGKGAASSGSITLGTKIWSDFDNRQLLKNQPFTEYCWTFN